MALLLTIFMRLDIAVRGVRIRILQKDNGKTDISISDSVRIIADN